MKNFSITLILLLSFACSNAQQGSEKCTASAEINFSTVPSLQVPGTDSSSKNVLSIAPSVSIRGKSGLGVVYSPYFVVAGAQPGIFMHEVTIGLEQYGKKDYELIADYNHFFITANSSIPTTPITNEIIIGGAYKKLWLSPRLSAGIGFGTNKETSPSKPAYDIELAAGVSHYFDWKGNNDISFNVTPSLLLNAGTNQYFSFLKLSKYISNSSNYRNIVKNPHASNKAKGNSGRNTNPSTTTTTSSVTKAQTLSVNNAELNVESTIEHGSFSLRPAASLYVPFSSSGTFTGYWSLNLSYYF